MPDERCKSEFFAALGHWWGWRDDKAENERVSPVPERRHGFFMELLRLMDCPLALLQLPARWYIYIKKKSKRTSELDSVKHTRVAMARCKCNYRWEDWDFVGIENRIRWCIEIRNDDFPISKSRYVEEFFKSRIIFRKWFDRGVLIEEIFHFFFLERYHLNATIIKSCERNCESIFITFIIYT